MFRITLIVTVLAGATMGLPVEQGDDHSLDYILKNLTAVWEELHDIRQEINTHMHHGHDELNHDQVVKEVENLHHEHHVHHLHHPHEGHNQHHDSDLLQHLTEFHGHTDDHSGGQSELGHGHAHHQIREHGHEQDLHHDDTDHHADQHHEDEHDLHGLHSHEDEHEYEHEHEAHAHSHDHQHAHQHDHQHAHSHDQQHAHQHDHSHDHQHDHSHDHQHDHDHDDHDDHDDDDDDDHDHASATSTGGRVRPGLALIPGRQAPGGGQGQTDPWMYATCTIEPNVDVPESNVRGSVIISQRKDKKGPVYFDLNLTGFDVAGTGRIHGFHVHERAVTDGSCGSTGGHFNPEQVVHGAPGDDVRHIGDLGNIEVDENGELHGHIIEDSRIAFIGSHSVIGKAIVIHAGVDDLGQGGDAGSLATGNAGGRLACCSVYLTTETKRNLGMMGFRFKG